MIGKKKVKFRIPVKAMMHVVSPIGNSGNQMKQEVVPPIQELKYDTVQKSNSVSPYRKQMRSVDHERINSLSNIDKYCNNIYSTQNPETTDLNVHLRYNLKQEIENQQGFFVNGSQLSSGPLQRDENAILHRKKLRQQEQIRNALNSQIAERRRRQIDLSIPKNKQSGSNQRILTPTRMNTPSPILKKSPIPDIPHLPMTPQPDRRKKKVSLQLDMDKVLPTDWQKRADSITNLNSLFQCLMENQVALQERIESQKSELDRLRQRSADVSKKQSSSMSTKRVRTGRQPVANNFRSKRQFSQQQFTYQPTSLTPNHRMNSESQFEMPPLSGQRKRSPETSLVQQRFRNQSIGPTWNRRTPVTPVNSKNFPSDVFSNKKFYQYTLKMSSTPFRAKLLSRAFNRGSNVRIEQLPRKRLATVPKQQRSSSFTPAREQETLVKIRGQAEQVSRLLARKNLQQNDQNPSKQCWDYVKRKNRALNKSVPDWLDLISDISIDPITIDKENDIDQQELDTSISACISMLQTPRKRPKRVLCNVPQIRNPPVPATISTYPNHISNSFSLDSSLSTDMSEEMTPRTRTGALSKLSQGIDMWLQAEIRRDMDKLEKKVAFYSVKK